MTNAFGPQLEQVQVKLLGLSDGFREDGRLPSEATTFTGGPRPRFCTIESRFTIYDIVLFVVSLREFALYGSSASTGVEIKTKLMLCTPHTQ